MIPAALRDLDETHAGFAQPSRHEALAREGNAESNLRKVSLWVWNTEVDQFLQLTPWEELPAGVILESERPDYVKKSSYAIADRSSVIGDCVLHTNDRRFEQRAEFEAGSGKERIYTRFIEFLPAGNARIPGGTARQAIFVATKGFANIDGTVTYTERSEGMPGNWAQLNVDTLTGRVRVYQP
jgi:hypothetical protein